MTTDYFEAKKTGGSKDSIEITVDVKADKVMDFANEIRTATIDEMLDIINKRIEWCREQYNHGEHVADVYALALVREDILTLKGEQI